MLKLQHPSHGAPPRFRQKGPWLHHAFIKREVVLFRCATIGPPSWVADLEDRFAGEDQLSEQFVQALKGSKPDMEWLK